MTAILILNSSFGGAPPELMAPNLVQAVNEDTVAQAVLPIGEITRLFSLIVQPMQLVLLGLTILIVVVSAVSILVSIYNSMSDRQHEIAVMRALGAGRRTVMAVVLLEAILLSLFGGVLGWFLGHGLVASLNPWLTAQTGVSVGFWEVATFNWPIMGGVELAVPYELVIIPGLILLASLVGYLPALVAYRTDVAKALTSRP